MLGGVGWGSGGEGWDGAGGASWGGSDMEQVGRRRMDLWLGGARMGMQEMGLCVGVGVAGVGVPHPHGSAELVGLLRQQSALPSSSSPSSSQFCSSVGSVPHPRQAIPSLLPHLLAFLHWTGSQAPRPCYVHRERQTAHAQQGRRQAGQP